MMETYEERLKTNYWQNRRKERKEGTMTNYDMDEIERERDRNAFASVKIGEESEAVVTVELPDDVILRLSLQAHERDITLNKMCGIALKDSLKNLEYRYEHQSKPQVLKEY